MNDYMTSIIEGAEKKLAPYERLTELLEYPEVQADKALYAHYLAMRGELTELYNAYERWKNVLWHIQETQNALEGSSDTERALLYEEIDFLTIEADDCCREVNRLLGQDAVREKALVLVKADGEGAAEAAYKLLSSLAVYLKKNGCDVTTETLSAKNKEKYPREMSLTAEGADALARTKVFTGVHKVLTASAPQSFLLTSVLPEEKEVVLLDKDVRIDLFHSDGAGGQNVNKVETGVRVTHLPTDIVITCRDERSQRMNKLRAMDRLTEAVRAKKEKEEKERVLTERRAQANDKRKKFVVDLTKNVLILNAPKKEYPFPLSTADIEDCIRIALNG